MKLYFSNSHDMMREIAVIDGEPNTHEEIYGAAMKEIIKFCNKKNPSFKIYYVRTWTAKIGGVMMTVFDVGSHTEFFYADRVEKQ